jgi:hypothetical protein
MSANRCRRIPPSEHCPVCRHRGGWCLLSPDRTIAICPRVASSHRIGEAGWLHRLDSRPAAIPRPVPTPPTTAKVQPPADADLDRVYRAILARLSLAGQHCRDLQRRGLTDTDVGRAAYRSLPAACRAPIARQLRDVFGDELLLRVPGLVIRDGKHGPYMTIAGMAGLLIPIRSIAGHIVGLVVRPDDPGGGGKYRWLSSALAGPSARWRVHVPVWAEPRRRVVIVEGSLKADVASALAPGRTIIGLPGCRVTDEAIAVIQALGAEEALLALDADASANHHVARGQLDGLHRLRDAGYVEQLIEWDPDLGKGLDDVLLTMRRRRS